MKLYKVILVFLILLSFSIGIIGLSYPEPMQSIIGWGAAKIMIFALIFLIGMLIVDRDCFKSTLIPTALPANDPRASEIF